jgi:hypothetical protein
MIDDQTSRNTQKQNRTKIFGFENHALFPVSQPISDVGSTLSVERRRAEKAEKERKNFVKICAPCQIPLSS